MTLSDDLERGHLEIDRGIESFASGLAAGDRQAQVLVAALGELGRHIYVEEQLLFPPLQAAGLVPPLFVMRREHGEIWATMDALVSGLDAGADLTLLGELVDHLAAQLQSHNTKEEMIVYPAAESMIPAPVREEISGQLGSAQRPEGWVCEAAR